MRLGSLASSVSARISVQRVTLNLVCDSRSGSWMIMGILQRYARNGKRHKAKACGGLRLLVWYAVPNSQCPAAKPVCAASKHSRNQNASLWKSFEGCSGWSRQRMLTEVLSEGAFTFTGLGESASASLGCSHRRDRRSKQLYPTCSELKIFPIASSEDILAVSITRTSSFQGSYSRLTTSSQVGSRRSLISAILVSTRSRCSRRFEQITSSSKIGALSDFATSRQASLVALTGFTQSATTDAPRRRFSAATR